MQNKSCTQSTSKKTKVVQELDLKKNKTQTQSRTRAQPGVKQNNGYQVPRLSLLPPAPSTADLQLSTINYGLVDPTIFAEILQLSTINHALIDSTVAAEILYLSTMFEPICVTSDQTALHDDLLQLGFKSQQEDSCSCLSGTEGSYLDCGVPELMFDGSRGRRI